MNTALDIVNSLGRGAIRRRFGVSAAAVSNNLAEGTFPADWYEGLLEMATAAGLAPPPLSLFRMRPAPPAPVVPAPEGDAA